MKDDLISRSALTERIVDLLVFEWGYEGIEESVRQIFSEIPAVDAVEVVRCNDCVHFRDWGDGNITCRLWTDQWDAATVPDAFCSCGERRTDDATD